MNSNAAAEQLQRAEQLGAAAYAADRPAVPAYDVELRGMLTGRQVGVTPGGEASTVDILDAWAKGWHAANLAATR